MSSRALVRRIVLRALNPHSAFYIITNEAASKCLDLLPQHHQSHYQCNRFIGYDALSSFSTSSSFTVSKHEHGINSTCYRSFRTFFITREDDLNANTLTLPPYHSHLPSLRSHTSGTRKFTKVINGCLFAKPVHSLYHYGKCLF